MPLTFDPVTNKWYATDVNADTTGAALAALETEVNQIKAALREAGIIKP
ncbi:MAG: hypothetical protein ACRD0W_02170 [Acidimicrobiales bacterium]